MGNIYIETDNEFRVTKIHRMPFDPNNGMGYSREELEQKGYFIDEIPEPVHQTGRRSIAMYNPDTKKVYYQSVGIPLSDKERVEYAENALNGLLGLLFSVSTMTVNDVAIEETDDPLEKINKSIGEYIAYQIISGKLDLEECLYKYPQCEEIIKEILIDNGIQV